MMQEKRERKGFEVTTEKRRHCTRGGEPTTAHTAGGAARAKPYAALLAGRNTLLPLLCSPNTRRRNGRRGFCVEEEWRKRGAGVVV